MKKKTIALMLVMVMLFGITVGGTIAYLTDKESVTNTFTIGKVGITLTETETDEFGVKGDKTITAAPEGADGNVYKLMPGHSYSKDPVITVDAASENSFIFVKVENGISAYEAEASAEYDTITKQITDNNWEPLTGVANVYYQKYDKGQADNVLEVFEKFQIADKADAVSTWANITAENTMIVITGYAVQADGMTDAADAWTKAGF